MQQASAEGTEACLLACSLSLLLLQLPTHASLPRTTRSLSGLLALASKQRCTPDRLDSSGCALAFIPSFLPLPLSPFPFDNPAAFSIAPCRVPRISRKRSIRLDQPIKTRENNGGTRELAAHPLPLALSAHPLLPRLFALPLSLNPRVVKDLITQVLNDHLKGREYDVNESGSWTKEIATAIKAKLKELKLPRYKFLVQVIMGEMKGAGVR